MGGACLVLWLSSTMMCPVGVYRVLPVLGRWGGLGWAGLECRDRLVRVAGCCSADTRTLAASCPGSEGAGGGVSGERSCGVSTLHLTNTRAANTHPPATKQFSMCDTSFLWVIAVFIWEIAVFLWEMAVFLQVIAVIALQNLCLFICRLKHDCSNACSSISQWSCSGRCEGVQCAVCSEHVSVIHQLVKWCQVWSIVYCLSYTKSLFSADC